MWMKIKRENRRIIIIKATCVFQNRRLLLTKIKLMLIKLSKQGICHDLPKITYQSAQTAKSGETVHICHKWSPCCL